MQTRVIKAYGNTKMNLVVNGTATVVFWFVILGVIVQKLTMGAKANWTDLGIAVLILLWVSRLVGKDFKNRKVKIEITGREFTVHNFKGEDHRFSLEQLKKVTVDRGMVWKRYKFIRCPKVTLWGENAPYLKELNMEQESYHWFKDYLLRHHVALETPFTK